MVEKMSRWGVGPVFALLSIGYGILMLAISRYFYPAFHITFIPYRIILLLGIILLLIGVPFFIASVITVMKAYNAGALVTKGIYGCCRHPLYSAWVVFIVPGIVLLLDTWIGLTVPLFMYLLLRTLVKKEETYLEGVFGTEYLDYKRRVPCIMPFGLFR